MGRKGLGLLRRARIEGAGCRDLRAVLRSLGFLPSEAGSHREGLSRGATMTVTALAAMWRADRRGRSENS